ncbi:MAG: hypothetical protein Q4F05_06870 [bacterium]|nr:hypothetical protein [bacterium]
MHNRKKVHGRLLGAGIFLLVIGSGTLLFIDKDKGYNGMSIETQLVVADQVKTSSMPEQQEDILLEINNSVLEDEENYALSLVPIENMTETEQGTQHLYAYVEADLEEFKKMSRENYHDFIDKICKYSYDYFTVVFSDGKGIVYYPKYAQWALYGTLDENKNCKKVESYIDAADVQVETVTDEKVTQIKKYINEITKEYKKNGTYSTNVEFLYDDIYEVRLTIDIQSDLMADAKRAIKEIEQKSNTKGYQLNFKISCMNGSKEVVTMSFGEEYVQYVYVENGHKVTLDSLE